MDKIDATIGANISKLTDGAKEAIIICSKAFRFGCNWGFLTGKSEDLREKLESFRNDIANVFVDQASNALIFQCDRVWLMQQVNTLLPGALQQNFIEDSMLRAQKERDRFIRMIMRMVNGKLEKFTGALPVAVYSMNEEGYLLMKGDRYPAYRLSVTEMIECLFGLLRDNDVFVPAIENNARGLSDAKVKSLLKGLTFGALDRKGQYVEIGLEHSFNPQAQAAIIRSLFVVPQETGALLNISYRV